MMKLQGIRFVVINGVGSISVSKSTPTEIVATLFGASIVWRNGLLSVNGRTVGECKPGNIVTIDGDNVTIE